MFAFITKKIENTHKKIKLAMYKAAFPSHWFAPDLLVTACGKPSTWLAFSIDLDYDILRYNRSDVGNLSDDRQSLLIQSFHHSNFPEKFAVTYDAFNSKLVQHICLVAYMAAYYITPAHEKLNKMFLKNNIIKLQKHDFRNNVHFKAFYDYTSTILPRDLVSEEGACFETNAYILKQKDKESIYINEISVQSVNSELVCKFRFYKFNDKFYYCQDFKDFSPFNVTPLSNTTLLSLFKEVGTESDLFAALILDVLNFTSTGHHFDFLPTLADTIVYDMYNQ